MFLLKSCAVNDYIAKYHNARIISKSFGVDIESSAINGLTLLSEFDYSIRHNKAWHPNGHSATTKTDNVQMYSIR